MPHDFPLSLLPVPLCYATHRIIRDCNEEFAANFGYQRDELVDASFSRLYPEIDDFIRTGRLWQTNLAGGNIYYDERIMRRRDGTRFWCRVRGRSVNTVEPFAEALYCFEPVAGRSATASPSLTPRQRQIVSQIAQGKTSRQIADELSLSVRTVEAHRARLMKALGLRNGAELVAWFSGQGGSDVAPPTRVG